MAFYVLLAYSKIKYVQNLYAMNPYQKTQTAILVDWYASTDTTFPCWTEPSVLLLQQRGDA